MFGFPNLARAVEQRLSEAYLSEKEVIQHVQYSLELSDNELTSEQIFNSFQELGADLRTIACRLDSQQRLVDLFYLTELPLRDFLSQSLRSTFENEFIAGLHQLAQDFQNQGSIDASTASVTFLRALDTDQQELLYDHAGRSAELLNQAVRETFILAIITANKIDPLILTLQDICKQYYLPDLKAPNFEIEGRAFEDLDSIKIVLDFYSKLERLRLQAKIGLDQIQKDSEIYLSYEQILERPGLLFFSATSNESERDAYRVNLRSLLRDKLNPDSVLDLNLTEIIQLCASFLSNLESYSFGNQSIIPKINPDLSVPYVFGLLSAGLISTGSGQFSIQEACLIRNFLQRKVDSDVLCWSNLSEAFTISYPKSQNRPSDRLTVKTFPVIDRKQNIDLTATIALEVPQLPEHNQVNWHNIERGLEKLLDRFGSLDRWSSNKTLEEAAKDAFTLMLRAFSVSEDLTNFETLKLIPVIDNLELQSPIFQFANIWHGLTDLEGSNPYGFEGSMALRRIHDWCSDYAIQIGDDWGLSFTDLAGISPLFRLLGDHYSETQTAPMPDPKLVQQLSKKYSSQIKLLPSGLHALMSLLPEEARDNLIFFLKSNMLIIDKPSEAAIEILQYSNREVLSGFITQLRDSKPNRRAPGLSDFRRPST
jgi:hypothetical protein